MQKAEVVLVCFALEEEARPFRRRARARSEISVLVTGIGKKNAIRSVRDCLQAHAPRRVFTCGFAGGLNPELETGDVVFVTPDKELASHLTSAGALSASLFCADRIATTAGEKAGLRQQTGADAVDMESQAIHDLCGERGIPCCTVRVISDAAGEDLPLDFNQLANADHSINYGKLAWAIMRSPGKIPALRRLQRHTNFAAEQLARVLEKVV